MENIKDLYPLISILSLVLTYFVRTQVQIKIMQLDKEMTKKISGLEKEYNEKIQEILLNNKEVESTVKEVKGFVSKIYELLSKGKKDGNITARSK
ncbi:plasmid recombination enzyme [Leptospira ryugenii]|uniref:Plasmid recombination enzyme n=1 Tax=Leptospira ryugenii TaxID=1917863 RepID=A0A2P2DXN3_9LEPT|nr:hypothetical protein [Leptospira ryugenii]GBF49398.1 plasmid recombination enzyme [Leptospira ryugenii]